MFQLDESVKPLVLAKLPPMLSSLLKRYWDQLVLYLLVAPLQWLHLAHLFYTTRWEAYTPLVKALLLIYVASCFTFWEGLRIFVYYTCRAIGQGENLAEVGTQMIASVGRLGTILNQGTGSRQEGGNTVQRSSTAKKGTKKTGTRIGTRTATLTGTPSATAALKSATATANGSTNYEESDYEDESEYGSQQSGNGSSLSAEDDGGTQSQH